ncbi:MAG: hypothetical protein AMJ37_03360, partial [Dehalococcoidia bacterium DG_18]
KTMANGAALRMKAHVSPALLPACQTQRQRNKTASTTNIPYHRTEKEPRVNATGSIPISMDILQSF